MRALAKVFIGILEVSKFRLSIIIKDKDIASFAINLDVEDSNWQLLMLYFKKALDQARKVSPNTLNVFDEGFQD